VDVGMEYRYTPIQIICTTKILYIYMTCIQATTKMGIEVTTTGICGVKGEIGQELFVPLQVWVVFEHKQPKIKGFP
jgi:hypothetical protein